MFSKFTLLGSEASEHYTRKGGYEQRNCQSNGHEPVKSSRRNILPSGRSLLAILFLIVPLIISKESNSHFNTVESHFFRLTSPGGVYSE